MLKRIITFERQGKEKTIKSISSPIEEQNITKQQLRFNDCIVVDADTISEEEHTTIKQTEGRKQFTHFWNVETNSVVTKQKELTFEEMSMEEKINYLYNQIQKLQSEADE
jgi:hypothetical protein